MSDKPAKPNQVKISPADAICAEPANYDKLYQALQQAGYVLQPQKIGKFDVQITHIYQRPLANGEAERVTVFFGRSGVRRGSVYYRKLDAQGQTTAFLYTSLDRLWPQLKAGRPLVFIRPKRQLSWGTGVKKLLGLK